MRMRYPSSIESEKSDKKRNLDSHLKPNRNEDRLPSMHQNIFSTPKETIKLSIRIPFADKTKKKAISIDVKVRLDLPLFVKTLEVEKKIQERFLGNEKPARRLHVHFGDEMLLLDADSYPALLQYKISMLSGSSKKTAENKGEIAHFICIDFVYKRVGEDQRCICESINAIDLSLFCKKELYRELLEGKAYETILLYKSRLQVAPVELFNKKSLQKLDLCGNNLSKSIENLQELSELRTLCLSNNKIEHFPANLGRCLNKLETLRLSKNMLKTLSEEICIFKNLKVLFVDRNKIETISPSIQNLQKLETLCLCANQLQAIPREISSIKTLENLCLRANRVPFSNFPVLPKNIVFFDGSKNTVKKTRFLLEDLSLESPDPDEGPIHSPSETEVEVDDDMEKEEHSPPLFSLQDRGHPFITALLKNLKILTLFRCGLKSLSGELFTQTPNLEALDLSMNNLCNLPKKIEDLSSLRFFNVSENNIHLLPFNFSKMRSLNALILKRNNIKTLPASIWQCPLETLNLSSNSITEFPHYQKEEEREKDEMHNTIPGEKPPFPEEALRICTCFAGYTTKELLSKVERLGEGTSLFPNSEAIPHEEHLSMAGCSICLFRGDAPFMFEGGALKHADAHEKKGGLKKLRFLDLGNNLLTTNGIGSIKFMTSLVWLNLSINEIRDASKILTNMRKLVFLNLSNNSISKLPKDIKNCLNLRALYLSCNNLTILSGEGLKKLKNLRVLDLSCNDLNYKTSFFDNDWNWNQNQSLQVLNLEENTRLTTATNIPSSAKNIFYKKKTQFALPELVYLNVQNTQIEENTLPFESDTRTVYSTVSADEMLSPLSNSFFNYLGLKTVPFIFHASFSMMHGTDVYWVFCIFDGQGDPQPARHLRDIFPLIFKKAFLERSRTQIPLLLEKIFISAHTQLGEMTQKTSTGCSTIAIVQHKSLIYIANAGANAASLYRGTQPISLCEPHSHKNKKEEERIMQFYTETGLEREKDPIIALRSLGDFSRPEITPMPTIHTHSLQKDDNFIAIGSYYFWKKTSHSLISSILRRSSITSAAKKLRDIQSNIGYDQTAALLIDIKKTHFWIDEKTLSTKKRANSLYELNENRSIVHLQKEIEPPTGNVTMVVTDIKGSTEFWLSNPLTMHAATTLHYDILRRLLRSLGGYEIKKEGDSLFAAFPHPESALSWCCITQLQIMTLDLPQELYETPLGRPVYTHRGTFTNQLDDLLPNEREEAVLLHRGLSIRMAIHTARPICNFDPVTQRADYFGKETIKTHRISNFADGGQIAISKEMYEKMRAFDISFLEDAGRPKVFFGGTKKLKGLEKSEEIYFVYPDAVVARAEYSEMPLIPVMLPQYAKEKESPKYLFMQESG
eukprot:GHVN01098450.1.p1 GENE.GHVN01098450.1~~GHVN01098450.1.p1  ORF type:complete len:1369 (-),score=138.50 GHVN01098450.1:23-4129(-)